MKSPPHYSLSRGFTLIELLTVIAVIGILAAILIPVVGRVRDSARATQCVSGLRQIGIALHLYADDHDERFPAANDGGATGDDFTSGTIWCSALDPYLPRRIDGRNLRDHELFTCPSANYPGYTIEQTFRTYSYTGAALGLLPGGGSNPRVGRRPADIPDHSRIPLVVEGKALNNSANTQSNWSWANVQPDLSASSPEQTNCLDFRHNGRMNVLYVDVSVRSSSLAEFKQITEPIYRGLHAQ
jgi:prepilin-type N-terminal cleavage/methylation domain-containing protein/prepilin-type processing-associated H-X9-DG protein